MRHLSGMSWGVLRKRGAWAIVVAIVTTITSLPVITGGTIAAAASTDPIIATGRLLASPRSADGSRIDSVKIIDARSIQLKVYSAAMRKAYVANVQRPADTSRPRPTLYLLQGAGGGVGDVTWKTQTDALKFLGDKNVNVVIPIGGQWSYYTDWRAPDPVLGVNKWKTFFTEELPPLIDGALGTNKVNAIAGLSMSGTSVLQLPIAKRGLYKAVAAYSGCAQISDPIGYQFVKLTVENYGHGKTVNMYGPEGDPMWKANDPYVNAEQLRGLNIFISTGNGVPGMHETLNGPRAEAGVGGLADQIVVGGVIETATDWCTRNMQNRLEQLKVPAVFDFQPRGTHSWGYWQDALKTSWPVLAKGLGLPV